jgi:fumarylacetoacetate (FAA) hydrolase family protein
MSLAAETILPEDAGHALLLARVWLADADGPAIAVLRNGTLIDITSNECPTMSELLERDDCADYARGFDGPAIASLEDAMAGSASAPGGQRPRLLAPCDLQVVKACGVTFAQSMLERVIEERASGDPERARTIREKLGDIVGRSLKDVRAGSDQARRVKEALLKEGLWSQYLEVGIGPDAEVFTKAPVLSAVGWGAEVGLHPASRWNNPEPEVVLAVSSRGMIRGAALGNDVNLRDIEGRSALLLGKAKDNNASCAIGPFIRLFDDTFTLDDVRAAELDLCIEGEDGFVLNGHSSMKEISRDPTDLVAQTIGTHHQYPDGFMLFLGTLFAPTQDRDVAGEGFTHKTGDRVRIASPKLGALENRVNLSTQCPPWEFGLRAFIANLSRRGLLRPPGQPG